ncbi:MAG: glycosyltransferase family 2 protein [Salaquimonas sp.]|nr:glycosyltransferase family 2 protein [Salaquimonas sp.]
MRRFSAIELEIVGNTAQRGTEGVSPKSEYPRSETVKLAGLRQPIPRGLYRISFQTSAEGGEYIGEIRYRNPASAEREGMARVMLSVRNGRAAGQCIMPEAAEDLSLKVTDSSLLDGAARIRLRRLSSLGAKAIRASGILARHLSHPSGLPALARQTLEIARHSGLAGLARALEEGATQVAREYAFTQRYRIWAREDDERLARSRDQLVEEADRLGGQPLISIVMPVFDPPADVLEEAIESVKRQIWPHWELCIADDASTNTEIRKVIEAAAGIEPRIRAVFRETNGHISEASNSALELASGQWVTFLDHDDRLTPHALLELAKAIMAHPDAGLIYSDEDKLDIDGERCIPHFKPDWNPELFLSYNLVTHIACYPTDAVREIGGFRKGYEGAQDYDLSLRIAERNDPANIVHIPRILYHWRMLAQSAAADIDAKPYAMKAGERALNSHLSRMGLKAKATLEGDAYRVRYQLPDKPPLVSIVIATRDRLDLLKTCVTSILQKSDYPSFEVIVVDNGSKDRATLDWLAQMEKAGKLRVLRQDGPFNFSALNNAGVAIARGEIIALVNNDIEIVSSGWLGEMVSLCLQPGVGVVGVRLRFPEGTIQHAGLVLSGEHVARHWFTGSPGNYSGPHQRLKVCQALSAVTGACLVTHGKLYDELGGLDADNLAIAYNDVDYCLKARQAGYRVVFTPNAEIIHRESASRGKDITPAKSARLYAEMAFMKDKWGKTLERDPMAMPGLPLELREFYNLG